jgi:hypothetical protein
MAGFFVSGYLYEHNGPAVMFFVSGLSSMVAGLIFTGYTLGFERRHNKRINPHDSNPIDT